MFWDKSCREEKHILCAIKQLGSHCVDFHEVWYLEDFSEVCRENSSFIKSDKNNGYFTW